eukprot:gb/GEZN01005087.1/.p1 GENE.gb/GEZN01005087.1/~~gb/GEZN01005087.1/.p1  ORF type:complete len:541 (-),score=65.20 gb/GEZN01005087.1/:160-1782(-)
MLVRAAGRLGSRIGVRHTLRTLNAGLSVGHMQFRVSSSISAAEIQSKIDYYSQQRPSALTVRQFMENKKDLTTAVASASYLFQKELPIRVSHMCKVIDRLPVVFRELSTVAQGRNWYSQTMADILATQKHLLHSNEKNQKELVKLSVEACKRILGRHANTVPAMAAGLLQVKEMSEKDKNGHRQIPSFQQFLDDLFMSRIGTRLCMSQYIELFEPLIDEKRMSLGGRKSAGVFDEHLDLHALLLEAAGSAQSLCEQNYGHHPELQVAMYQTDKASPSVLPPPSTSPTSASPRHPSFSLAPPPDLVLAVPAPLQPDPHGLQPTSWLDRMLGDPPTGQRTPHYSKVQNLTFSYVPSHLYHILFELLKNSMRAVSEYHQDQDTLPAVRVILVKAEHDLTIKIEDQGGGVPLHCMDKLWQYSFTTAPRPATKDLQFSMNSAPMCGFGYGLPLSRLYARYFGGDLRLVSTEGYGMDSLIYLKAVSSDAKETLTTVSHEDEATLLLTREELIQELRAQRKLNQQLTETMQWLMNEKEKKKDATPPP